MKLVRLVSSCVRSCCLAGLSRAATDWTTRDGTARYAIRRDDRRRLSDFVGRPDSRGPGRFVAQSAKLRKSVAVLGPIGVLLGSDDVVESGDVHHDAANLLGRRCAPAARRTRRPRHRDHGVPATRRSDPSRSSRSSCRTHARSPRRVRSAADAPRRRSCHRHEVERRVHVVRRRGVRGSGEHRSVRSRCPRSVASLRVLVQQALRRGRNRPGGDRVWPGSGPGQTPVQPRGRDAARRWLSSSMYAITFSGESRRRPSSAIGTSSSVGGAASAKNSSTVQRRTTFGATPLMVLRSRNRPFVSNPGAVRVRSARTAERKPTLLDRERCVLQSLVDVRGFEVGMLVHDLRDRHTASQP